MKDTERFILERQKLLQARIEEVRKNLMGINPDLLARNCHAVFLREDTGHAHLKLRYWQDTISISYPEYLATRENGQELAAVHQALLMYYLSTSDGTAISNGWISFSELPGGIFYQRAFQGYTGAEIEKGFKNDIALFAACASSTGGIPHEFGDTSYLFNILPCVQLLVVSWRGDEDFPTTFQVLFNASAAHFLPTDAYAIVGSILTQKLLAQIPTS